MNELHVYAQHGRVLIVHYLRAIKLRTIAWLPRYIFTVGGGCNCNNKTLEASDGCSDELIYLYAKNCI